jgi:threonine aldolase
MTMQSKNPVRNGSGPMLMRISGKVTTLDDAATLTGLNREYLRRRYLDGARTWEALMPKIGQS